MRRTSPNASHSLHDRTVRRGHLPQAPTHHRRKKKGGKPHTNPSSEFFGNRSLTQSRLVNSTVLRKLNKQLQQRNTAEEMSCSKVSEQGVGALDEELVALEACLQRVEGVYGGRGGEPAKAVAEMRERIDRLRGYCKQYCFLGSSLEFKSAPGTDALSLLDGLTRKYERLRLENEQLKRKLLDGQVAKLSSEQHHPNAELDLLERKTAEANSLFTDLLVKDERVKQLEEKLREAQAAIHSQGKENRRLRKENNRLLIEEKERMDPFRCLGSLKERLRS